MFVPENTAVTLMFFGISLAAMVPFSAPPFVAEELPCQ